jgi:cytochrome P450
MSTITVDWDPFTHSSLDDPYPTYRALREDHPVYYNPTRGVWALTRFADVQGAARDLEAYSNAAGVDLDDTSEVFGPGNFIDSDPPRHDELRGLVRGPFAPKAIGALEGKIRRYVRERLTPLAEAGGGDIAQEVAWPVPVWTVCELMGFPVADADKIQRWVSAAIHRVSGDGQTPSSARHAVEQMHEYFARMAADRRQRPRDDLLSKIATGRAGAHPISDELAGLCTLLCVAGTETTFSLIGNAVWTLAAHREQRQRLARDPTAVAGALEEVLRFESPVQYLGRITTRDVQLHGTTIPAGERVALLFGGANRDGARWDQADAFDIDREPQRHLAFGEGIHHCLGAPLARLEGRIVLEELLRSMPDFTVAGPVARTSTYTTRGFESLPVAVN